MTTYWRVHNEAEAQRVQEVFERHGVRLRSERHAGVDDDFALKHADGVILMSNEVGRKTYPDSDDFLLISNATYGGDKLMDLSQKDFEAGRNGFLFLAGSGNVHKRLDLVLEAFVGMPDKHLYICTKLEDDFARLFHKELFETPNIHYIGHIRLYTPSFYDLIKKCNHILFTSVSEGSPGGVIDGMVQGLIPLVSVGSHIDVDDLGYIIEPCTVETIQQTVRQVSAHDAVWHTQKCRQVQKMAVERFSIERYRTTFKKHIQAISDKKKAFTD